ncbi:MAG: PD-(D/E)XK nuclease family protein [Cyclobacteriaceae bacterium]|nr:PD-(D/E)XK nuclease family protein [Cyclobacteriaceae bacterium]MCB0498397.1 PD-(D/E)XK nuclease family protein [Cyclobacteriaceae bacterium]MCB9237033.1 PD-(D/E)XK nuclease family protein [Flammeovirgaceae bacterium]MCO5271679.1 PD-(D/E)XK nuclease family protein [Cyclobacteriaceae bacterium]MCW5901257.1 PD-(D/E)XK nuclease family protein [Cyclobacteriaceae bacterium]
MQPFLKDIAQKIAARPNLGGLTIVFPNRRAALFFQKYLSEGLARPTWSPRLVSIESFFSSLSELREPDRLSLIHRLYRVYNEVMGSEEPFDRFYFWGDMLLRDFDEVDKYMVDAPLMFRDLSKLKELDESFDFLTEGQRGFLKGFWANFEEKPAGSKESFLKVWRKLPKVYATYVKSLKKEKLGYEGMVHREVAVKAMGKGILGKDERGTDYVFAGFNALTKAEETLIGYFVGEGAACYWDLDAYYVEDNWQEAGRFFRQYRNHPVLSKTFEAPPANFKGAPKEIKLTGVPQRIGQAKLVGQALGAGLPPGDEMEKTVIVLPDEAMLLPVLHSLPPGLPDVNVTMGYSLGNTPLYNLLDLLIELQLHRSGSHFSHRQVTAILAHAYVLNFVKEQAQEIKYGIIEANRVYIPQEELALPHTLLEELFQLVGPEGASEYLLGVVKTLGTSFSDGQGFDKEYAFHFYRHLSRLHEVLHEAGKHPDWRGFQKLFRQVVISQKIPFSGEPLKGLQVMGVLETRNLDFENVFLLSLNEGMLPSAARQGSYIPHSIRRAYQLPTHDHQDAMYAYLFYRLLQRAKKVSLYYNTEPDVIGNGEMSRFAQQLVYESGLGISHHVLHNPVQANAIEPVAIAKTGEVMALLGKYIKSKGVQEGKRDLSPSALNDFMECKLKFYLKHLAGLREAGEVEEDLDARLFGNLLHDVVYWFYEGMAKENNGRVEKAMFRDWPKRVDQLIDKAFIKLYHLDPGKPVTYEGQRIVVRTIAREFVGRIIQHDKAYAPFAVEALEAKFSGAVAIEGHEVMLGGKIDRVDSKDGTVRIIDYKTGNDELVLEDIASLFNREGKRNKAAFQTMLYAYLYYRERKVEARIVPGLMNRKNLFDHNFSFGHPLGKGSKKKGAIEDARQYFDEFEKLLVNALEDLYDPESPFDQTTNLKACSWCPYKGICRR